ncbi:MAG: M20/M25/M40 family metallo-hydrolase [Chloroflexi bacterium]|nr:M20/M25/M40 family metallo-hydrolase [Chloroflexota bacterium]
MDSLLQHIEDNVDGALETLFTLVRQPSVSAQRLGFDKAPQLVADTFTDHGFASEILDAPNDGLPSVYGYAPADPEAFKRARQIAGIDDVDAEPPTLMLYVHYDVQPTDPIELWETDPFEPTRVGERLYGRGMSDDKGNIAARLAVINAFKAEWGGLPCNVKIFAEGEEESGSPNLPGLIENHKAKLTADACIWEGGGRNAQNHPLIYLGLKGVLAVELSVSLLNGDAHSSYATVLPSAAWTLVNALNSIKDPTDDRILVEGFYDDVRDSTPDEDNALANLPDDTDEWRETFGNASFVAGLGSEDLPRKHLFMPTANIAGLDSGYQGEGMKTVLPAKASAKMDFRLVPDMRPDDIFDKVRRHLDRRGFENVELNLTSGVHPFRTDMSSKWAQMAIQTSEHTYGKPAVIYPTMAGSGPMYDFGGVLGIPITSAGIDHPTHKIHAPNENITVEDFILGAQNIARLTQRFAGEWGKRDD